MTAGAASDATPGTLGPVQILTVAFDGNRFRGEILPLLEQLKRADVVRLIALIEHRWAIELREAIARADGIEVLNEWLQPGELIQIGLGTSS